VLHLSSKSQFSLFTLSNLKFKKHFSLLERKKKKRGGREEKLNIRVAHLSFK